ncbi:hypothetical protein GCM10009710_05560 [Aeromicrobium alkaliterrae]|uniref:Uncharacterized protein n=1 Tax=Aeromicrobium alkaliterrae TaxID=302168 RepID=A0ABP4VM08_9ACTN
MILGILLLVAVFASWRTLALVMTDGYGDRPGPRSHDHEYVAPWRA